MFAPLRFSSATDKADVFRLVVQATRLRPTACLQSAKAIMSTQCLASPLFFPSWSRVSLGIASRSASLREFDRRLPLKAKLPEPYRNDEYGNDPNRENCELAPLVGAKPSIRWRGRESLLSLSFYAQARPPLPGPSPQPCPKVNETR